MATGNDVTGENFENRSIHVLNSLIRFWNSIDLCTISEIRVCKIHDRVVFRTEFFVEQSVSGDDPSATTVRFALGICCATVLFGI